MTITLTRPAAGNTTWAPTVHAHFQTTRDWLNNGAVKAWADCDGVAQTLRAGFNIAGCAGPAPASSR
jgi:ribosomal protein L28